MRELSKHGLYFDYPTGLPPETGERALQEQAAALSAVCDDWEARQRQVMADPHLSADARREQLAALTTTEAAAVERALT